jgi:hypothetical protein
MTDTPEDWVLIEAAKRGRWHSGYTLEVLREAYQGFCNPMFHALCDMIAKHEQKPVDRKLLCAREAGWPFGFGKDSIAVDACIRAIELWEEGFGK